METKKYNNNNKITVQSKKITISDKKSTHGTMMAKPVEQEKNVPEKVYVQEQKVKNRRPLPIVAIFSVVALTILFTFLIVNYAVIDDITSDIADLKSDLVDLQTQSEKLSERLRKKNDNKLFEEMAVNDLGMVKSSEVARINITGLYEDEGQVYDYENEEGGIGVLLDGFKEIIESFFGAD